MCAGGINFSHDHLAKAVRKTMTQRVLQRRGAARGTVTSANDAGSSWGTDTQGRKQNPSSFHLGHHTVNTLDFDL